MTWALSVVGAIGLVLAFAALLISNRRGARFQSGITLLVALVILGVSLPDVFVVGIVIGAVGTAFGMWMLWREVRR